MGYNTSFEIPLSVLNECCCFRFITVNDVSSVLFRCQSINQSMHLLTAAIKQKE